MIRDAAYLGLLLLLKVATLSAQTRDAVYDRVILGGHVMDPASQLDAVRNIGLQGGRIAVITTDAIRGLDTIDARGGGLIVAPGFIDLHAHGQTPETYRFYALDGVTTPLELELGRRMSLPRTASAVPANASTTVSASATSRSGWRCCTIPGP